MKKTGILAFITLIAIPFTLNALEVDRSELQSVSDTDIVFQNYTGPHSVINTAAQITAIGTGLAPQIRDNPEKSLTSGSAQRYQIIHAVDPNETGKLDADIFIIGENAGVDHIRNVRRIIAGYLTEAYGYSQSDADTISVFITVYNAVYRGKIDVFRSKYKKIVINNLSPDKCGLALDYREWPGKTQIVIPLNDVRGGLSTIETSVISDKQVVSSLQGEEDKGIEVRKEMVDIKEREADNASEKAQEAQRQATEENAKLKAEQEKTAQAQAQAAQAQAQAEQAQTQAAQAKVQAEQAQVYAEQTQSDAEQAQSQAEQAKAEAEEKQAEADKAAAYAAEHPEDAQAQADAQAKQAEADEAKAQAEQAQAEAEQAQSQAEEKQAEAEQAQSDAEQAQSDAEQAQAQAEEQAQKEEEQAQKAEEASSQSAEAQAEADKKRSEAQEERSEIARDQQTLVREAAANANVESIYGLKAIGDGNLMSSLVRLNAENGDLIKESPVTVIRGRTIFEVSGGYLAIAGTSEGNGAVKLVVLDKEHMEIANESVEIVAEDSILINEGENYYCVIQNGENWVVGKFNADLEIVLKSDVSVNPATPITITEKGIIVTSSDKKPVILNLQDLKQVK